ncbi:unnamed protein product [Closterium sp. Yama58-4]|nr:unnamed protein product [Closterium sp. Yama58-4]
MLADPYGIDRWVYPHTYANVGDYPEQCKVGGTKSGINTKYPCPKCKVPNDRLSDMTYEIKYRTEVKQSQRVAAIQGARTKRDWNDLEVLYSTHGVEVCHTEACLLSF